MLTRCKRSRTTARCEVCDLDFEVDLANSIEMIFRVHPEIREAELGTFCIGGPEHSPHVVLQVRVAAGKRVELAPLLSEGEYVLRSAQLTYNIHIRALPAKGTTHTELVLSPEFDPKLAAQVRAGRNVLTITNDYDHDLVVRLERITPRQDVVTAAQASAMPLFRELFPDERPEVGRLINVATATFLALDLSDSDSLFVERGDGETYGIVSQFHRRAERISQQHSGAIVKVMDTEVLFAFESPSQALRRPARVGRQSRGRRACTAFQRRPASWHDTGDRQQWAPRLLWRHRPSRAAIATAGRCGGAPDERAGGCRLSGRCRDPGSRLALRSLRFPTTWAIWASLPKAAGRERDAIAAIVIIVIFCTWITIDPVGPADMGTQRNSRFSRNHPHPTPKPARSFDAMLPTRSRQ